MNYQRLVSDSMEAVFERVPPETTVGDFRETVIGDVRKAMSNLFPDLALNSLGNPLSDPVFRFDKGTSKRFVYPNLSGGEKAAFDLILDLIVKRKEYDDTVFCIDEPEAYMSTRVQGALLDELMNLLPITHNCGWPLTQSE